MTQGENKEDLILALVRRVTEQNEQIAALKTSEQELKISNQDAVARGIASIFNSGTSVVSTRAARSSKPSSSSSSSSSSQANTSSSTTAEAAEADMMENGVNLQTYYPPTRMFTDSGPVPANDAQLRWLKAWASFDVRKGNPTNSHIGGTFPATSFGVTENGHSYCRGGLTFQEIIYIERPSVEKGHDVLTELRTYTQNTSSVSVKKEPTAKRSAPVSRAIFNAKTNNSSSSSSSRSDNSSSQQSNKRARHEPAAAQTQPVQDNETESEGDEKEWVQCNACNKWRSLPHGVDVASLPEMWTCAMNSYDKSKNKCSAPEEDYENDAGSSDEESDEEEVQRGNGRQLATRKAKWIDEAATSRRSTSSATYSAPRTAAPQNKNSATTAVRHCAIPPQGSAVYPTKYNGGAWVEPTLSKHGRIAVDAALERNRKQAQVARIVYDSPVISFTDADGQYTGQMKGGKLRHGRGKNVRREGDGGVDVFEGDYFDGEMTGYGVYTYSNNDRFEGFWGNSVGQGQGVYWTSANGNVYAGHYVNDQRNGYGEMHWGDGGYHKGQWLKGVEKGQGSKRYAGSSDVWEGDWNGPKELNGKAVSKTKPKKGVK
eukprot:gene34348-42361_t